MNGIKEFFIDLLLKVREALGLLQQANDVIDNVQEAAQEVLDGVDDTLEDVGDSLK